MVSDRAIMSTLLLVGCGRTRFEHETTNLVLERLKMNDRTAVSDSYCMDGG